MKNTIYALITICIFSSCDTKGKGGDGLYISDIRESITLNYSDGTKFTDNCYYDGKDWETEDETCEYRNIRTNRGNDVIDIIFGRSKKYSYELTKEMKTTMIKHFPKIHASNIMLSKYDFYKVCKVTVNDEPVFENNDVLSDTAWSEWEADLNASYRISSSLILNLDNDLKVKTYEYESYSYPKE